MDKGKRGVTEPGDDLMILLSESSHQSSNLESISSSSCIGLRILPVTMHQSLRPIKNTFHTLNPGIVVGTSQNSDNSLGNFRFLHLRRWFDDVAERFGKQTDQDFGEGRSSMFVGSRGLNKRIKGI